jgi:hypothetical protein
LFFLPAQEKNIYIINNTLFTLIVGGHMKNEKLLLRWYLSKRRSELALHWSHASYQLPNFHPSYHTATFALVSTAPLISTHTIYCITASKGNIITGSHLYLEQLYLGSWAEADPLTILKNQLAVGEKAVKDTRS